MSVATKRKLAKQTNETVDTALKQWQEACGRGDVQLRDATPIVDALLDLKTACLLAADPGK